MYKTCLLAVNTEKMLVRLELQGEHAHLNCQIRLSGGGTPTPGPRCVLCFSTLTEGDCTFHKGDCLAAPVMCTR